MCGASAPPCRALCDRGGDLDLEVAFYVAGPLTFRVFREVEITEPINLTTPTLLSSVVSPHLSSFRSPHTFASQLVDTASTQLFPPGATTYSRSASCTPEAPSQLPAKSAPASPPAGTSFHRNADSSRRRRLRRFEKLPSAQPVPKAQSPLGSAGPADRYTQPAAHLRSRQSRQRPPLVPCLAERWDTSAPAFELPRPLLPSARFYPRLRDQAAPAAAR